MCFLDHCRWGNTPGLNDQIAVGAWHSMQRYIEVSSVSAMGGFRNQMNQRRYYDHLVIRGNFRIVPLLIAFHLDHTVDEQPKKKIMDLDPD